MGFKFILIWLFQRKATKSCPNWYKRWRNELKSLTSHKHYFFRDIAKIRSNIWIHILSDHGPLQNVFCHFYQKKLLTKYCWCDKGLKVKKNYENVKKKGKNEKLKSQNNSENTRQVLVRRRSRCFNRRTTQSFMSSHIFGKHSTSTEISKTLPSINKSYQASCNS